MITLCIREFQTRCLLTDKWQLEADRDCALLPQSKMTHKALYEYIFNSGNIVSISGNIFLYPPKGHPMLYKYWQNDVPYHGVGICKLQDYLPNFSIMNDIGSAVKTTTIMYTAAYFKG